MIIFPLIAECTKCGSNRFTYNKKFHNSENGRWVCEFLCNCGFQNLLCGEDDK